MRRRRGREICGRLCTYEAMGREFRFSFFPLKPKGVMNRDTSVCIGLSNSKTRKNEQSKYSRGTWKTFSHVVGGSNPPPPSSSSSSAYPVER